MQDPIVECPHCGARLRAPKDGRQGSCPRCKASLAFEEPAAQATSGGLPTILVGTAVVATVLGLTILLGSVWLRGSDQDETAGAAVSQPKPAMASDGASPPVEAEGVGAGQPAGSGRPAKQPAEDPGDQPPQAKEEMPPVDAPEGDSVDPQGKSAADTTDPQGESGADTTDPVDDAGQRASDPSGDSGEPTTTAGEVATAPALSPDEVAARAAAEEEAWKQFYQEREAEKKKGEEEKLARERFDASRLKDVIGAGGGAGARWGGRYGRRGSGRGGGKASQRAVELGLEWLRRHQDPDGFWDSDGFWSRCKDAPCGDPGSGLHDVGATAIALLSFLGAGNTVYGGRYQQVVKNGLHYLKQSQTEDGCFGPKSDRHFLHGHALAALAMVEGYHLSGLPLLKRPAQRGVDFIAMARNPGRAWRYDFPPVGDNDVALTGWMLLALFTARDAGLKVDAAALREGMEFVDAMTDPATWRTGYHSRGGPPSREPEGAGALWPVDRFESTTAQAMLLRILLGERPGEGDLAGSWDASVDPWGRVGGRVYATAINTLSLEVYYRYDKVAAAGR